MKLQEEKSNQTQIIPKMLMTALSLALAATTLGQQSSGIHASLDGKRIYFNDIQPVMVQDHVYVPIRGVFEQMNTTLDWNENTQTVTAHHGNETIDFQINSRTASVNGRRVELDAAPIIIEDRAMVPLRAMSELLGASVEWFEQAQTVEITTNGALADYNAPPDTDSMRVESGTVLPFRLAQRLTSNRNAEGDRFSAVIETDGSSSYQGIPRGSSVEGHLNLVRARMGDRPGLLGLYFDRLRLPNGRSFEIHGTLTSLDSDSVQGSSARWTARQNNNDDNLKYVGYGAAGGALLSVVTRGNLLTDSVLGGALGGVMSLARRNNAQPQDVQSEQGSRIGVRLTRDLLFRIPMSGQ